MILYRPKNSLKRFRVLRDAKSSIEPEEIILDAQKENLGKNEGEVELPIKEFSFSFLFAICLVILFAFSIRIVYLVVFQGETYAKQAQNNKTKVSLIMAPRGIIYDRNKVELANNVLSLDLAIIPVKLSKDPAVINEMTTKISEILKVTKESVLVKLAVLDYKSIDPVILYGNLKEDQALVLEGDLEDVNGVEIERNFLRQYPLGKYLAQTLGYAGQMSVAEKSDYPEFYATEKVGKSGLEAEYETFLHGQVGKKETEVDAKGKKQRLEGIKDPTKGDALVLSIDSGLQKQYFDSLEKAVKGLGFRSERAAGVAMNPKTGEILAMVSLPSFDPNIFSKQIESATLQNLFNNPEQPFLNRAIAGQYPPGSTIKIIVAAAGLQEEVITPKTTINATGSIRVQSIYDPKIWYTFPDWKIHGITNLYKAIAQSSDVYFYAVGGGYDKIVGLGIDRLTKYFNLFGLGQKTGIDLPGEKVGIVPTPAWKKQVKNEDWFLGDTYHISIGQGDLTLTPIQLAVATSAIANGGKIVKPFMVDKILDSNNNVKKDINPEMIRQLPISQENLQEVRNAMREMVVNGTGSGLKNAMGSIAAKSGSAQYSTKTEKTRAWFTGFAPFDDPRVVVTLVIEEGQMGLPSIIPAARDIFNYYFTNNQ